MFVRCPACTTQFRVRAAHLSAAAGRVRCGVCGQAFDAVSRLSDEPLAAPAADAVHADAPVEDFAASGEPGAIDIRLPQDVTDEHITVDEVHERGPEIDAYVIDKAVAGPAVDADWVEIDEDQEPARPRHTGRWVALASVLVLVGLGQAAWFNRDVVYSHFPQVLPWVEKLCERLQCQVYRQRQPTAFQLIHRDVRVHPVYQDALLVNATFVNQAERRQPYPHIQLALFDTSGRALAYREFAPAEYLGTSLPVITGMAPDKPLHVVLELSDSTEGAVSYEFGFL